MYVSCVLKVGKWPIHVQVSHYAGVACKRLERIGFGGKRQPRKPSTEDIDQARVSTMRDRNPWSLQKNNPVTSARCLKPRPLEHCAYAVQTTIALMVIGHVIFPLFMFEHALKLWLYWDREPCCLRTIERQCVWGLGIFGDRRIMTSSSQSSRTQFYAVLFHGCGRYWPHLE